MADFTYNYLMRSRHLENSRVKRLVGNRVTGCRSYPWGVLQLRWLTEQRWCATAKRHRLTSHSPGFLLVCYFRCPCTENVKERRKRRRKRREREEERKGKGERGEGNRSGKRERRKGVVWSLLVPRTLKLHSSCPLLLTLNVHTSRVSVVYRPPLVL